MACGYAYDAGLSAFQVISWPFLSAPQDPLLLKFLSMSAEHDMRLEVAAEYLLQHPQADKHLFRVVLYYYTILAFVSSSTPFIATHTLPVAAGELLQSKVCLT